MKKAKRITLYIGSILVALAIGVLPCFAADSLVTADFYRFGLLNLDNLVGTGLFFVDDGLGTLRAELHNDGMTQTFKLYFHGILWSTLVNEDGWEDELCRLELLEIPDGWEQITEEVSDYDTVLEYRCIEYLGVDQNFIFFLNTYRTLTPEERQEMESVDYRDMAEEHADEIREKLEQLDAYEEARKERANAAADILDELDVQSITESESGQAFTNTLSSLTSLPIVESSMLLSLTIALIGYLLFGKKC